MTIWQLLFIAAFLVAGVCGILAGLYLGYLIFKEVGQSFKEFLKDTFKEEKK